MIDVEGAAAFELTFTVFSKAGYPSITTVLQTAVHP